MQDIGELQARMSAALDRIGQGLGGIGSAAEASAALRTALAAERERAAALEERLRAGEAEHAERLAALEADLEETRALLAGVEEDRGRLRATSDALRATCERLRDAATRKVADAEMVNGAMKTEIEALGAARRSDRAELDAIVDLLGGNGETAHG